MKKIITITTMFFALNLNAQSIQKNLDNYYSDTFNKTYEISTTFVNNDYLTINVAVTSIENLEDTLTLIINEYQIENFQTLLVLIKGTYEKWKTASIENNLSDFKKEIDLNDFYNTPYLKKDKYLTLFKKESDFFIAQIELKAVFIRYEGKYILVLTNKDELKDFRGNSKSSHQGFYLTFTSAENLTRFIKKINLENAKNKFK